MRLPSPVRLTTRPLYTATVGSIRSLRSTRRRARVRSSGRRRQPQSQTDRIVRGIADHGLIKIPNLY
jgi:hypothetical protein